MNFMKETISVLDCYDKNPDDILFIGTQDGNLSCSWAEFLRLSNFEYDDGFGGHEINLGLIIRFADGVFYRHEYDGAEGWGFISTSQGETTEKLTTEDIKNSNW